MKDDLSTSLHATFQRAVDAVIDEIAKDGVRILKGVVDSAGFGESEYLKNYDVFAHVDGGEILFEIVIDASALELKDKHAQEIVEGARPAAVSAAARTYGMGAGGVQRQIGRRDARKGSEQRTGRVRDARTPARDARKTSGLRLLGHEMSAHMPRSANVTRSGKLSVFFRRSLREGTSEIKYPRGKLQGLIQEFVDKLADAVADKFAPELEKMLKRRLS